MRILVIEDLDADRDLIKIYIKNSNTEVEAIDECKDLKSGKEKIKTVDYDAILLDLNLPDSNGLETVQTITSYLKEIHKTIPIIIMTGLEDYKIGPEAFKLGIKDYLIKGEASGKEIKRAITFATYCRVAS